MGLKLRREFEAMFFDVVSKYVGVRAKRVEGAVQKEKLERKTNGRRLTTIFLDSFLCVFCCCLFVHF